MCRMYMYVYVVRPIRGSLSGVSATKGLVEICWQATNTFTIFRGRLRYLQVGAYIGTVKHPGDGVGLTGG